MKCHYTLIANFILTNLYTFQTNIVSRSYRIIKGLAPTVIRIWLCFGQRSRFSPVFSVTITFAAHCQRSWFHLPKNFISLIWRKRMLFQTKQAWVFKAMNQSPFLAREKVLNFDGCLSDFESTTLKIS